MADKAYVHWNYLGVITLAIALFIQRHDNRVIFKALVFLGPSGRDFSVPTDQLLINLVMTTSIDFRSPRQSLAIA